MKTIKGPAIFLAQFIDSEAPFNSFAGMCEWASGLGYKGIQVPTWDEAIFDLTKAANSTTYCSELKDIAQKYDIEIAELSAHIQGQLMAIHPAYNTLFDGFAPSECKGSIPKKQAWAKEQMNLVARAAQNLGLDRCATFSGSLLWPTVYPWPQRPAGLVELGFDTLSDYWMDVLNYFDARGVDLCYELHPGEDLHDGVSFERFLEACDFHPRINILYDPSHFLLQQMDYLSFIDIYREFIKMFHVKDAEFNPTGRQGVYGGYSSWVDRAGRFRSLGDGQVDFVSIFSKLSQYNFDGWATLEWECALKDSAQGASEGVGFIQDHIIQVAEKAFDDFAGVQTDEKINREILGL